MENSQKNTPLHTGSGALFQTPILSSDEKTFIRTPYQIPKMRKLSNLMEGDQFFNDENYNYNDSSKLFYRHKDPVHKDFRNMTNKILNQCQKNPKEHSLILERSPYLSEREEFCSENQQELNKSKSEEFSIVSMPAKLELHDKIEPFSEIFQNSELDIMEGSLDSSMKEERPQQMQNNDENLENFQQKALHELHLKDAIHRQNQGKMRKYIEELKLELDKIKTKQKTLLFEREKDANYIKKCNKELQNYEISLKKTRRDNQELKARNMELELVLKEILFEKELNKSGENKKNSIKNSRPLQNITNCPKTKI